MQIFDKNGDGRLDLSDLARFLLCVGTGELEGPEVDGFVKDMMELLKPSLSGLELDVFRKLLLNHCDLNNDGKIQKNELALCLGIKL
uniref:EF-hand domain-containing protein n=1 Tax=Neogobius melanostomus TaxID=47308 RepID=A0A8C6TXB9_9GOBI